MQAVLFVLFVCFILHGAAQCPPVRTYTNCANFGNPSGKLYWSYNATHIRFAHTAAVTGWLGFGISTDGSMTSGRSGSDAVVGYVDAGSCSTGCINDFWINSKAILPQQDTACSSNCVAGTNDITLIAACQENGVTTLEWERLLNTGDTKTDRIITLNTQMRFIHARHLNTDPVSFTDFKMHSLSTFSSVRITLNSTSTICAPTATPSPSRTPSLSASSGLTPTASPSLVATATTSPTKSILATPSLSPSTLPPSVKSYTNPSGTFSAKWEIVNDTITFTVTCKASGWCAIGVSNSEFMPDTDVMWATVSTSDCPTGCFSDRWASARSRPSQDAKQDITPISAQENSGITTFSFSRLLNTGDTAGDVIIEDKSQYLMYAFSSDDGTNNGGVIDFDIHDERGFVQQNFFTGAYAEIDDGEDRRRAHAIFMLICWGLLVFVGQFVARYLKYQQGVWWYRIHVIIMATACVGTVIGFALIVDYIEEQGRDHFDGAHQVIGLIIVILMCLQPSLGVLADRLWSPKRKRTPIFPDFVHHWVGRLSILLGFINIGLGLDLYCVTKPVLGLYIAYFPIIIILMISFEVMRWFTPWGWYFGGSFLPAIHTLNDLVPACLGGGHERDNKNEPPLVFKIITWVVQYTVLLIILAFFIAMAAEIGEMDVPNLDSYYDDCIIGQLKDD